VLHIDFNLRNKLNLTISFIFTYHIDLPGGGDRGARKGLGGSNTHCPSSSSHLDGGVNDNSTWIYPSKLASRSSKLIVHPSPSCRVMADYHGPGGGGGAEGGGGGGCAEVSGCCGSHLSMPILL
jgi:hypothetical protein